MSAKIRLLYRQTTERPKSCVFSPDRATANQSHDRNPAQPISARGRVRPCAPIVARWRPCCRSTIPTASPPINRRAVINRRQVAPFGRSLLRPRPSRLSALVAAPVRPAAPARAGRCALAAALPAALQQTTTYLPFPSLRSLRAAVPRPSVKGARGGALRSLRSLSSLYRCRPPIFITLFGWFVRGRRVGWAVPPRQFAAPCPLGAAISETRGLLAKILSSAGVGAQAVRGLRGLVSRGSPPAPFQRLGGARSPRPPDFARLVRGFRAGWAAFRYVRGGLRVRWAARFPCRPQAAPLS